MDNKSSERKIKLNLIVIAVLYYTNLLLGFQGVNLINKGAESAAAILQIQYGVSIAFKLVAPVCGIIIVIEIVKLLTRIIEGKNLTS